MKKPITLMSFICISFFSFTNGEAQLMSKADPLIPADFISKTNSGTPADETKVNGRALRNFNARYKQASNAKWSVLKDNSQLCNFQISSVTYRAFYNPDGSWSYTVSSYDGKELDKTIQDRIQDVYNESQIVYVNQVDMHDKRKIYLVEVQDDKSIKKIRIEGEDMELVSNFSK